MSNMPENFIKDIHGKNLNFIVGFVAYIFRQFVPCFFADPFQAAVQPLLISSRIQLGQAICSTMLCVSLKHYYLQIVLQYDKHFAARL